MKFKHPIKKLGIYLILVMFVFFGVHALVDAGVTFNIGPTTINMDMVYYWWTGYQGIAMGAGDYMSLNANFDNYYKVNSGFYNVTTQVHSGSVQNYSGYSVPFYRKVPVTALYRAYIANLNYLPMRVTSGTVFTTP